MSVTGRTGCLLIVCPDSQVFSQVSVRREAKSVGRSALKRAAWFRNRQESLLVQRRTLANELMNVIDVEAFAGTLAKPLPQLSAGKSCWISCSKVLLTLQMKDSIQRQMLEPGHSLPLAGCSWGIHSLKMKGCILYSHVLILLWGDSEFCIQCTS